MTNTLEQMPISPELYQQTLERLRLGAVYLEEIHASCDRDALEQGGVTINIADETFTRQTPTRFLAYIYYHLAGVQGDVTKLQLDARYCLAFDTDSPVPSGFSDVFREVNLKMTTLPYFRELAASVTGRMELPTLTLPYKLFVPDDDEEAIAEQGSAGTLPAQPFEK